MPEKYGGQGLSQTGYARVFEAFAQIDATLSIVLGVHQSIGFKGIHMFGTDEQKERFLPDLASGRKLAGFALTEPNAGSDAYNIESRAVQQPDGSWVLNGEKRYIGNGSKGSVFTAFARCEVDGKDRHIALILEKGMKGFEVGERFDTMGLRGNDLRRLYFKDVRVPAENVLGEPGEGFRIAMQILNNGRIGLGTGSVGGAKGLLDLAIDHVKERRQFGRPLADFELVQEKIGWMVSYLFGLESMAYLTCGLVDSGVQDYSLESAICKVSGTEFLWYAANRALQLAGGAGYMKDQPYEKILRDIRIFPIFEGANDVLRAFIALTGMKPVGEKLSGLGEIGLGDPIGSIGVLVDYVGGRIQREVRPDRITKAHPELQEHADAVSEQVKELASVTEKLLRKHRKGIVDAQLQQKRIADALADIYAQIAVLSRVTAIFEDQGVEASGQERFIADTFCERAPRAASAPLPPDRRQRRRADDRDRQARLQARRVRLRAVRGLTAGGRPPERPGNGPPPPNPPDPSAPWPSTETIGLGGGGGGGSRGGAPLSGWGGFPPALPAPWGRGGGPLPPPSRRWSRPARPSRPTPPPRPTPGPPPPNRPLPAPFGPLRGGEGGGGGAVGLLVVVRGRKPGGEGGGGEAGGGPAGAVGGPGGGGPPGGPPKNGTGGQTVGSGDPSGHPRVPAALAGGGRGFHRAGPLPARTGRRPSPKVPGVGASRGPFGKTRGGGGTDNGAGGGAGGTQKEGGGGNKTPGGGAWSGHPNSVRAGLVPPPRGRGKPWGTGEHRAAWGGNQRGGGRGPPGGHRGGAGPPSRGPPTATARPRLGGRPPPGLVSCADTGATGPAGWGPFAAAVGDRGAGSSGLEGWGGFSSCPGFEGFEGLGGGTASAPGARRSWSSTASPRRRRGRLAQPACSISRSSFRRGQSSRAR